MFKGRTLASLVVVGAVATVLFTHSESRADGNCNSADSCARVVTCPGGFEVTQSAGNNYCSRQVPERTDAPSCAFHNMRNDWVWVASERSCRNGAGTRATTNIRCDAGYSYSSTRGLCVSPSHIEYVHAVLTESGQFSGTARGCDSQSQCAEPITCAKSGFSPFRVIAPGPNQGKWLCSKSTPGVDEAPTCAFHNFRRDWTFVPSIKACRNGAGTSVTTNIRCENGTYNASSGRCTAPSVVEFDDPRL
jgi:hypothetical protein